MKQEQSWRANLRQGSCNPSPKPNVTWVRSPLEPTQFLLDIRCILQVVSILSLAELTSCRRAAATICPRPSPPRGRRSAWRRRADDNVAAVSHAQHVPTPTTAAAWRANTAVSKADWWPWLLTIWPWNLKVVSESRVTWATSVPILVFLGLSVLHLGPMYVTHIRQTYVRQHHRFAPAY